MSGFVEGVGRSFLPGGMPDACASSEVDVMQHEQVTRSTGARPKPNPGRDVQLFLDAYGDALLHGDVEAIASMWHVPSLVLSGNSAIPVSSTEEIERFFTTAVRTYEARGIVATNPEIEEIQWLTS